MAAAAVSAEEAGAGRVTRFGRDLAAEAAVWLAARPEGATFKEIAAGIHARASSVRHAVRIDKRFIGPFGTVERPRAGLYALAPRVAGEPSGTVAGRDSQATRILRVLSDRKPHTVTEIHRRAGTSRLNSRVAELRPKLRAQGLEIECTRIDGVPTGPDAYRYQLKVAA